MASGREINSFECSVCGATIESWNTAWVPTYRLIVGSVSTPAQGVGSLARVPTSSLKT